jgi:ribosomal protein S27AE
MILIHWKFACNKCGYKFQAETNEKMYLETIKCIRCGSTEFKKELIGE